MLVQCWPSPWTGLEARPSRWPASCRIMRRATTPELGQRVQFLDVLAIDENGSRIWGTIREWFVEFEARDTGIVEQKVGECGPWLPGPIAIAACEVLGAEAARGGGGDRWVKTNSDTIGFFAVDFEEGLESLKVGWSWFGASDGIDLDFEARMRG